MRDPRYPAALWRPGVNAGYHAGRTPVTSVVCHYTVGVNSLPVMDRGYFNFLVSRDGTVHQGAEVDAVCWHAGSPWNGLGPGIEVEHYQEPAVFTDAQRDATGALVRWLHAEWGVQLRYYCGTERVANFDGFIAHRSVIQTGDWHSDYWPQDDWDRMVTTEEDDDVRPSLWRTPDAKVWVYNPASHTRTHVGSMDALNELRALWSVTGWDTTLHENLPKLIADAAVVPK